MYPYGPGPLTLLSPSVASLILCQLASLHSVAVRVNDGLTQTDYFFSFFPPPPAALAGLAEPEPAAGMGVVDRDRTGVTCPDRVPEPVAPSPRPLEGTWTRCGELGEWASMAGRLLLLWPLVL